MNDTVRRHLHAQADAELRSAEHYKRDAERLWGELDQALTRREDSLTRAAEFRAAAEES